MPTLNMRKYAIQLFKLRACIAYIDIKNYFPSTISSILSKLLNNQP